VRHARARPAGKQHNVAAGGAGRDDLGRLPERGRGAGLRACGPATEAHAYHNAKFNAVARMVRYTGANSAAGLSRARRRLACNASLHAAMLACMQSCAHWQHCLPQ